MITALTTSVLGLLYLYFSVHVISARRKHQISLGSGPKGEITGVVSAHANFAAYVPLLLILMYFLEHQFAAPKWMLLGFGAAIIFGRVFHFVSLSSSKPESPAALKYRAVGMILTFLSLALMSLLNIGYTLYYLS